MIFFIRYDHYFQLNLDETCFLCYEGELKIIGDNNKPRHEKNCSDSRFSITVLRVGSEAGVNGPVIFLAKVTKVHPRLRGNNLVTKYVLPVLLQVELLPRGTKRKPVIRRLSQQRHHYLTC